MLTPLIWVTIALIAVCALMMVIFGVKNGAARLKGQGPVAIIAFVMPLAIFGIIYAVNAGNEDGLATAFIMTAVVLIFSGLAALVFAGVRGLLK
ncbi:hypothetical protein [Rubricoccus marinus]|nr:hypothetical protein [Rubricoccus marinus]